MVMVEGPAEELLLAVPARTHGGFQLSGLRRLEGRAERTERCIDIVCFLPERAVPGPLDELDSVPAGNGIPTG